MEYSYISTGRSPLAFRLRDLNVFFTEQNCLDIIASVLDEKGGIRNFPGIIEDRRWTEKLNVGRITDVRYEAVFCSLDDRTYLMKWMIQPSGWYWMDDDGFGMTSDSSITLYSILDHNGNFLKQFELFSIDQTRYCSDFDAYL